MVCLLLYCLSTYLTVARRTLNVVRHRTYQLILLAATGNAVNGVVTGLTGTWLHSFGPVVLWVCFYLGLLSEYLFFAPYFLRGILMKTSFIDFLSEGNQERLLQRLKPGWYCKRLIGGFVLLSCFPLCFLVVTALSPHTPFTFTYDASDVHFYMRAVFTFVHFIEVMSLLFLLHYLRHLQEPHSLTREMQLVCLVIFLAGCIDAPMWPYIEMTYLLLLVRDMALLVICSLWPVLVLWNEKISILPTPETIRCLEFAFQHAETLEAFQLFLRGRKADYELSASYSTAHSQEGEGYLWFLIHLNELESKPNLTRAKRLLEMMQFETSFPSRLIEDSRSELMRCSEKDEKGIVATFESLRCYATTVLSNQFYPKFTASEQFLQLERRVQMLTKLWGSMSR